MKNHFYQSFDTERLQPEKGSEDYRSPFQVDRDRVLHTPAFRQLQSKTQVFWSGEYDFYRTRLTHSLEVAQIGRSICAFLRQRSSALSEEYYLDADLVEAICLSHDLGHPPFGHAGEKSLNGLMEQWGGFEGNAQTLRLLTERIFSVSRRGMNPTRAFADGVMKYKSLWGELGGQRGEAPFHHFLYDEQWQYVNWILAEQDFPVELTPGKVRDGMKSIECQVMDWADDVAYSLNDLSDSVRAGFLSLGKIERWAEGAQLDAAGAGAIEELLRAVRENRLEPMLARRIGRYITAVKLEDAVTVLSAHSHRYRYALVVDEGVRAECDVFKRLAFEVVFRSTELHQLEFKGNHMLSRLWEALVQEYVTGEGRGYALLPRVVAEEIETCQGGREKRRLLCDYLASLSDSGAQRLYQRLFVAGAGSIVDLV